MSTFNLFFNRQPLRVHPPGGSTFLRDMTSVPPS